jgi:tRNA threonylcarbamoyl adenosine modification protein (Sua5/YciO/YrdC/YwlC family)
MAEFIKIHPANPDPRKVSQVVQLLKKGAIGIYPTDTVYGLGCDILNPKSIERIARIKGIKPEKNNFSFICYDLSNLADYARPVSQTVFKLMKRVLPGPFTFILESSNKVPKLMMANKSQVGIRVPDHKIPLQIVNELGNPIVSTSIYDLDEVLEYTTDPELIYERFKTVVDFVIDGGYGNNVPSTIVDCTGEEITIIRQGLGEIESYL